MAFKATKIAYKETNSFSKIVLDYLDDASQLKEFSNYPINIEGFKKAVKDRAEYNVNRTLLVDVLNIQYATVDKSEKLEKNIQSLLQQNTYTVCTAHQPNIFTGHLYFIYKILHAIKLSEALKEAMPENNFVPVYYMGSENADLDELGEVHINDTHYKWQTNQAGAVGRMVIDRNFIGIIDAIAGHLSVEKNGEEIIKQVRLFYKEGTTIELATFQFVHYLFNEYGLVILLPDNRALKNEFSIVIKKELEEQFSEKAVAKTVAAFPKEYKVQAAGRTINLFYLDENRRERIETAGDDFVVANTKLTFTKNELSKELKNSPEKFSPNVILRPVFQEMILPNIAFIGGGGELAYWLELKKVFEVAGAFFPPLVLRNSFLIINKKTAEKITNLGLGETDIFKTEKDLIEEIVQRDATVILDIKEEKEALKTIYDKIKAVASDIDGTLNCHVHALRTQALNRLEILEKKMLKAEKKKFETQQRQIKKIKSAVYPTGNLQERVDNILEYSTVYGKDLIGTLYENSNAFSANFTILIEQ
ncbi:MAG: bacillithiol biosynthesis cysteine-adding enzyme BshC [Ferruginibacter sp.]